jgi:hypothetical protein
MKSKYTHIAILLDRSGSMQTIASDIIGGFNRFIQEQKTNNAGDMTLSLVQFDEDRDKLCFDYVYNFTDIQNVSDLNNETFVPRGMTPLIDAACRLINETGQRLAAMPEEQRPEKVLFVTITDGHENASKEFRQQQLAEMTKHQEERYNWQFVYIGANQDAIQEALKFGFKGAANYTATSVGTRGMFSGLSKSTLKYRNSKTSYAADGSILTAALFEMTDADVQEGEKEILAEDAQKNQPQPQQTEGDNA